MSGVNKAIIIGNLGQDPEVRTTNQGVKVVTLSVATSESWKDKRTGERKDHTDWHRVVIWGSVENDGLAGIAEEYLRKGSKVYVAGAMKTRKWTDQKGVERYTTEVVLQGYGAELVLLDKREGGGRPPPAESPDDYGTTSSRPGGDRPGQGAASAPIDDGDIPFMWEARA